MTRTALFNLAMMLVLVVASGSACPRRLWQPTPPPPVVFGTMPSLSEVSQVINTNRAQITGVYSTNAKISGSGFPALRTNLAIGSPTHIRMRAGTGVTGQEMDIGSNDQVFWVWIKRAQPAAVYYGRHDQFNTSTVGQILPVRPEWLVEAIGLVTIDPNLPHQGPFRRTDGMLEVHTQVASPEGPMTRVLVIDSTSGWIREQLLLDPQRQVVASAFNSDHFRDPASGAALPRRTDISWPAAGMKLTLEFNDVQIGPLALQGEMWAKPEYAGFPNVDVTRLAIPASAGDAGRQAPVSHAPPTQQLPITNPWRHHDIRSPPQSAPQGPVVYGQQPYRPLP